MLNLHAFRFMVQMLFAGLGFDDVCGVEFKGLLRSCRQKMYSALLVLSVV